MKDITSTITKPLAVLGENGKGYTKEANFISWNGNAAKLDIREWHPNHERCGKGITLTEDGTIFVVNAMPAENAKHTQEELVKALIAREAMALQEAEAA